MSWLRKLWQSITALITGIASFVFQSFTHYDQVVDDINHIVSTWNATKLNIESEVAKIKDFKFDPRWKTRVINVPIAAEQLQKLKALLFDDWKSRIDKLVSPVHELTLILHQEAAPDPSDPTHAISALSKAQVKLGEVVVMIHQVRDALDQVSDFVQLFDTLRNELESLDSLFLQQGNPKVTVDDHYRKRQRRQQRA